jgi:hypothetical protein
MASRHTARYTPMSNYLNSPTNPALIFRTVHDIEEDSEFYIQERISTELVCMFHSHTSQHDKCLIVNYDYAALTLHERRWVKP